LKTTKNQIINLKIKKKENKNMAVKSYKEAIKEAQMNKENEQRKKELEKNLNICEQNQKQAIEKGKRARQEGDKTGEKIASKQFELATKMKNKYQQISLKIAEGEYYKEMVRLNQIIDSKETKTLKKSGKKLFESKRKTEAKKNELDIMTDISFGEEASYEVSEEFQKLVDNAIAKEQDENELVEEVLGTNKESNEN